MEVYSRDEGGDGWCAANWAIIIISRAGELKQTEQGPTTDPGVASMEASASHTSECSGIRSAMTDCQIAKPQSRTTRGELVQSDSQTPSYAK
ncbi:hypothetical protein E4U40_003639 [Claviceps sp. LM458 group G5]|nr:hypothetical protein E4U40_003639 [Claviceps sp. LM458 group G5]